MRFYVTEQISPKIAETPEGFLVCQDVPITRTGILLYGGSEVPLEADQEGNIQIEREAEDVFSDITLSSFEGKPVTIDHPDDFVTPENWKELAVGTTQNIRRGVNNEQDFLFADLLITDETAIELVRSGLREVSCGYDADYEQLSPGRGKQKNIIGNHIALVSKGRAGARCAIGDSINKEDIKMSWKDKIKQAFSKTLDSLKDEEFEKKEDKTTDAEVIMQNLESTLDKRIKDAVADCFKKTKDAEEEEKKKEEEEKKSKDKAKDSEEEEKKKEEEKTKDKAYFTDISAKAEILAPGYITKDSVEKGKSAKEIKREVVEASYKTADGKKAIEIFTDGPVKDWATVPDMTIDMAFVGASKLLATKNNGEYSIRGIKTVDFGGVISPAEMNAKNAAYWASHKS